LSKLCHKINQHKMSRRSLPGLIVFGLLSLWMIFPHAPGCLADAPGPKADPTAIRPASTVPFALGSDGRIYVQGTINGQVQATFLIDTGMSRNLISSAIEDKLHLPMIPVTVDGKPDSKRATLDGKELECIKPATVVMGQFRLNGHYFILQPPKRLPVSPITKRNVDGIIGAGVLDLCAIMIDFAAKRMALWYPSNLTDADIKALHLDILYTVPIAPDPKFPDVWYAHVHFSSDKAAIEKDMMIDTGAQITTLSQETAERLGLAYHDAGVATLFLNKKTAISRDQVSKMQMGDFTLFSHTVYFPVQANPNYPVSIGMDIFRGYEPLIDFGRRVMYLAGWQSSDGASLQTKPQK